VAVRVPQLAADDRKLALLCRGNDGATECAQRAGVDEIRIGGRSQRIHRPTLIELTRMVIRAVGNELDAGRRTRRQFIPDSSPTLKRGVCVRRKLRAEFVAVMWEVVDDDVIAAG